MKRLLFLLVALTLTFVCFANNPDDIVGYWKTGDGKAIVQIYKKEDKFFGKIVWLAEPKDPATGQPKKDGKNEKESLRERPLLGMENLTNFSYVSKGVWEKGEIYDPKSGETYSCTIKLTDPNTLDVRGYVGISLFGRTDTWKRQKTK
jgi:uncharacterized protein (DUF2147 family)